MKLLHDERGRCAWFRLRELQPSVGDGRPMELLGDEAWAVCLVPVV